MNRAVFLVSLAVLCVMLVAPARGQKLYGAVGSTLYNIDPGTGVASNAKTITIGGVPTIITALECGPGPRPSLYGVVSIEDPGLYKNTLVTIDTFTGAATIVTPINYGINTPTIAFDKQGTLYGIARLGAATEQLVTIAMNGAGTPIGSVFDLDISGMDSCKGWMLQGGGLWTNSLVTINPGDGSRVIVGPLGVDPDREGWDYWRKTGTMYALMQHNAVGLEPTLFRINLATGQAVKIGELGLGNIPDASIGLASVPEPGLVALAAVPALALLRLRRRR